MFRSARAGFLETSNQLANDRWQKDLMLFVFKSEKRMIKARQSWLWFITPAYGFLTVTDNHDH